MKGPVQTLQASAQVGNGDGRSAPDFSEYVWMAEELDEFDKKVQEDLWEEDFLAECFEQLLTEEDDTTWYPPAENQASTQLVDGLKHLNISQTPSRNIPIVPSRLNPNAPEFVPRSYGSDES